MGALVLAGGCLVALVGTTLPWSILRAPWLANGELRRDGISGDGFLPAMVTILCLLLVLPAWRWRGVSAVTALLTVLVLGQTVYAWRDIAGRFGRKDLDAIPLQVGDGVWFTLVGAVVMVAGALILLVVARRPS